MALTPKSLHQQMVDDGIIPGAKATNPKDAIGSDKLPLHLWPESATAYGCIGMLNGMLKYGRTNWRAAGVRPSIYIDAAKRHLNDWFEGQDSDPEDGVHNLSAALACIAIVIDAMESGMLNDDRQFPTDAWRSARAKMEPHVKRLKERYADRDPKHWTITDAAATAIREAHSDFVLEELRKMVGPGVDTGAMPVYG